MGQKLIQEVNYTPPLTAKTLAVIAILNTMDSIPKVRKLIKVNGMRRNDMFFMQDVVAHLSEFNSEEIEIKQGVYSRNQSEFGLKKWLGLHTSLNGNFKVRKSAYKTATCLDAHLNSLNTLLLMAPNMRLLQYRIRNATESLTYTTGLISGTFSKKISYNSTCNLKPNGKSFCVPMVTIGIWSNYTLCKEYLFWDYSAVNSQLGINN